MNIFEKLALYILMHHFPYIDLKSFKDNKDEVEAITFSVTESYINKVQKL